MTKKIWHAPIQTEHVRWTDLYEKVAQLLFQSNIQE
jgi:hypothetical protein